MNPNVPEDMTPSITDAMPDQLLSRGDQVVGGGNGGGWADAAATPNSRDDTNKDGKN